MAQVIDKQNLTKEADQTALTIQRNLNLKLIRFKGLLIERVTINKQVAIIARPEKVKPVITVQEITSQTAQDIIDNCEVKHDR